MRNAFAEEITKLAVADERIVLLSGDIGNRLFDTFTVQCPGRFHNCGVAEANMIGVAAGLALAGLRPVCYTITPFITYRCMEQIRIDVCYHDLPVLIVGTGAGLAYASLGGTHHSCEEVGMLRLLPGLNVLAPADAMEVRSCLRAALAHPRPTYMRIGKKGEPPLHSEESRLGIGKAQLLRDGIDLLVMGVGPILGEALEAAEDLAPLGISVAVASLGGIKPLDQPFLVAMAERFPLWLSLEEHGIAGGLGSALLEWLSDRDGPAIRLRRLGVPDAFLHELGNQSYARRKLGLDARGLTEAMHLAIKGHPQ